MEEFKITTNVDTPTIIHKSTPSFEAFLEGEDGDWIGRIEWADELSDSEKDMWKQRALDWYEKQTEKGMI